jgi:hypothetical protein
MVDLWDVFQQGQIEAASASANLAQTTALNAEDRVKREIGRLEAKIDGLALVSQALWELVRERTNLTDHDIRAKSRLLGVPTECKRCGRSAHTRQTTCMYCGTGIERKHVFER